MRILFSGKFWIMLVAMAGLVGLVILTAGLSGVRFDEPSMGSLENVLNLRAPLTGKSIATSAWLRYAFFGMLLVLFLLLLGPIRPQTSRSLLMQLARFSFSTFVLMLVMSRLIESPLFRGMEEGSSTGTSDAVPPAFTQPEVSSGWEYGITSLIVIAAAVAGFFLLNRTIGRWFQPKNALQEIADIARSALSDLSTERESKNAIIRCYARMTTAVNEHRGITRDAAMTPAEFAVQLERAGLPGGSVHALTQVFERVRYGGQNVSPQEIKEAKQCLTSIVQACETQK